MAVAAASPDANVTAEPAFERSERRLERAPCRVPVPAVLEARVVAYVELRTSGGFIGAPGDALRPAGLHRDRVGDHSGSDRQRRRVERLGHGHVLISASGAPEDRLAAEGTDRSERMKILDKPPTTKAGTDRFIGDAWFDLIVRGDPPSRVRASIVRFAPGARNHWHRHAVGQTFHVTDGVGRTQARGGDAARDPGRRHGPHAAR